MNRLLSLGSATALAGVAFVSPLASQDIKGIRTADGTQRIGADVSNDLDRQLDRIDLSNWRFHGGFAQVRFQVDPERKAENVTLYRRSGGSIRSANWQSLSGRPRNPGECDLGA